MKIVMVGAGGHARAVVEALTAKGATVVAYCDPKPASWLAARHVARDDAFDDRSAQAVIGIGGTNSADLRRRLAIVEAWRGRGFATPPVVHPAAFVSDSAALGDASQVLAGAVVQPAAQIGRGVIVNTGAIVEHDAVVGDGAHIAPGAVVLGAAKVGACAMIGANAVVLPGADVPAEALVRAGSLWQESAG